MDNKEFRKELKRLNLNIKTFAYKCGIGYSTAKDWKIVPKWVPFVLGYIEITRDTDVHNVKAKVSSKEKQILNEIKKIIADI